LKRAIQKELETPLGRLLLKGEVKDEQAVIIEQYVESSGGTGVSRQHGSGARLFGIVRVTNRLSKATLQLVAAQDDLPRMYSLYYRERHDEIPRILHIDHQFGSAVRRNRPNPRRTPHHRQKQTPDILSRSFLA
jgi:hypothetical protein